MIRIDVENLRLPRKRRRHASSTRLWREWCFLRVVLRHFAVRFAWMAGTLLVGAMVFQACDSSHKPDFLQSLYFTWGLVFGELPAEFPPSLPLRIVFFLTPVVGITLILEGIVDFSLTLRDRRRHERSWCMSMARDLNNHIVLVGFGKLGYQTYRLLRRLGEAVVIIERDSASQFLEEARRDGTPIFIGDARREAMLHDANLRSAQSIIIATDDDLANLEIALDARRIAPRIRVVLRMFDQNMAEKIRHGFGIPAVMSQSAISAPMFAMSALDRGVENSFIVDNQLVIMQSWNVRGGGPLDGKTVADVLRTFNFSVVRRRNPAGLAELFPAPDVRLEAGDELVVQGSLAALDALSERSRGQIQPTASEMTA